MSKQTQQLPEYSSNLNLNNLFPGTEYSEEELIVKPSVVTDDEENDDSTEITIETPTPEVGDEGNEENEKENEEVKKDALDFLNNPETPTDDLEEGEGDDEDKKSIATKYYEVLTQEGLLDLPEDFEFKGDFDSLKEAAEKHKERLEQAAITEIFTRMTPELKAVVQYGLSGGTELKEYMKLTAQVVDYSKIDTKDEEGQVKIMSLGYKEKGLEESKINALIKLSKEAGTLEADAESVKAQLLKESSAKMQQEQARIKLEQEQEAIKESQIKTGIVNQLKELKWRQDKKAQVYKQIYEETPDGNRKMDVLLDDIQTNPTALIALADFLTHYDPTRKEFDLEKYKKTKSQVAKNLKNNWEKALGGDSQSKSNSRKLSGSERPRVDFSSGNITVI